MTHSRLSALGLDVGRKRIGIAGCDGTGLIATGLMTLERRSLQQDLETLRQIIEERQVEICVVGLPYNMDGSLGFQAKQVQKFAQRLTAILGLPVEFVDERLTSIEAEELIRGEGRSPVSHHNHHKHYSHHNKGLVDRKAAALILQRWLDERREGH
jgi:putative holliday junction resolvase